jgi:hypothetical protein
MSAQVLTDVQLLLGSMELGPFSGSFDQTIEATMREANNLAGRGYTIVLPGLTRATAQIDGHADYASGAVSSTFNTTQIGAQFAFSVVPSGTAAVAGDSATLMRGRLANMKMLTGPVGEVADFSMGLVSDTAPVDGYLAATLASRTTSGLTGTAVQVGAVSASQRLYAALHVTAAAGTNLAVKIQSAPLANFASPTDRITFSTVSAVGWQHSSVAGAITDTWWRALVTIASVTFTFAVTFGIA